MPKKQLILWGFVSTEIVAGLIFLFRYWQQIIHSRVLGVTEAAIIDKESVVYDPNTQFKYYYQLSPNVIEKDNPSWLSYTATYTFNSDGLNDRYDYEIPKPEDVYRIVTLGDSFTFGFFVNTVDSWPEQLEDMFVQNSNFCNARRVEVINLGMGGFDIPYMIERYKNIGDKYRPNLILWFESGSGFSRINELIQPLINECKAASAQEVNSEYSLVAKQEYFRCWVEAEEQIKKELTESGITSQLTPYWDDFFQTVDPKRVFYLTFKSIPGNNDYANPWNFWQKRYHESNFLAVIEDLEANEYLPDGHPSVAGHRKIAQDIFAFLEENKASLPDCN